MLMMVEKGITGGICHAIHMYVKANNKYMKNYNENIESLYLMYLDANSVYGWASFNNYLSVENEEQKQKTILKKIFSN